MTCESQRHPLLRRVRADDCSIADLHTESLKNHPGGFARWWIRRLHSEGKAGRSRKTVTAELLHGHRLYRAIGMRQSLNQCRDCEAAFRPPATAKGSVHDEQVKGGA